MLKLIRLYAKLDSGLRVEPDEAFDITGVFGIITWVNLSNTQVLPGLLKTCIYSCSSSRRNIWVMLGFTEISLPNVLNMK